MQRMQPLTLTHSHTLTPTHSHTHTEGGTISSFLVRRRHTQPRYTAIYTQHSEIHTTQQHTHNMHCRVWRCAHAHTKTLCSAHQHHSCLKHATHTRTHTTTPFHSSRFRSHAPSHPHTTHAHARSGATIALVPPLVTHLDANHTHSRNHKPLISTTITAGLFGGTHCIPSRVSCAHTNAAAHAWMHGSASLVALARRTLWTTATRCSHTQTRTLGGSTRTYRFNDNTCLNRRLLCTMNGSGGDHTTGMDKGKRVVLFLGPVGSGKSTHVCATYMHTYVRACTCIHKSFPVCK